MAKIKETQSQVSQTINIKEILGRTPTEAEKQSIGQALIDRIIERTESGKGLSGKNLKSPYSKEYADSLEFKAFGKSRGKVNMTLTGDMLASIDILRSTRDTITIGIEGDQAAKAFNHQTGDTVPKRRFFGVTQKDIRTAVSNNEGPSEPAEPGSFVDRALSILLGDSDNDTSES